MRHRLPSGRVELVGRLPVRGMAHPLRRNASRVLIRSSLLTSLLFLIGPLAAVMIGDLRTEIPERQRDPAIVIVNPLPPPLVQDHSGAQGIDIEAIARGVGIPEPMPDFLAEFTSVVDVSTLLDALTTPALGEDFGPGDSIVIELPDAPHLPSPQEFVPVEVQPALIELPAPVYPEMARMAGVEGTVVVRVLVGAKGTVLDAILVEGHVMLNEAALSSARAALYRPALQQNHPIPVWVIQRITFKLD